MNLFVDAVPWMDAERKAPYLYVYLKSDGVYRLSEQWKTLVTSHEHHFVINHPQLEMNLKLGSPASIGA